MWVIGVVVVVLAVVVVIMGMVAVVTISPFRMPVAAERPACYAFPSHSEAAVRPSVLTLSLSL